MRKFWRSLRFWITDSSNRKGESAPVADLKVPISESGWGSKAPRTSTPEDGMRVPADELGWGTKAPKTKR